MFFLNPTINKNRRGQLDEKLKLPLLNY